jgi:hypothetical protein
MQSECSQLSNRISTMDQQTCASASTEVNSRGQNDKVIEVVIGGKEQPSRMFDRDREKR